MKSLRRDRARSESPALCGSHSPVGRGDGHYELQSQLAEFSKSGVPSLRGFVVATIPETSFSYLMWSEQSGNLERVFNWKTLDETQQKKQAVVRELVGTEANYIHHLMVIVEVFVAAAHALQDSGKMLDVDTSRLFSNIPDLLNANLHFWNLTFYPMVKDAVENNIPYKVELMADGFSRFHEVFQPYEKYMYDQSKMIVYLRHLQNNPEFALYLNWCHSNKSCNRLQLADLLVKPMQRLTKYSLILSRVAAYTDTDTAEESVTLKTMENNVKMYVTDLNRSMRQRDEIERIEELTNIIEPYSLEFKDEEMERAFKSCSALNLSCPMLGTTDSHLRSVIYECDLRFRDNVGKEMEVRIYLLTDMILVCKKQSKGSSLPYRMIRPKVLLERLIPWQKTGRTPSQPNSLVYIIVDDFESAIGCFTLSESSKEAGPSHALKTLEVKIKEAKCTRELFLLATMNASRDFSEMESMDSSGSKVKGSEEAAIESDARERVACMLHRGLGLSTDEYSQSFSDSCDVTGEASSRMSLHRQFIQRTSNASSRQSRLSSFQQLSRMRRDSRGRPLNTGRSKSPCALVPAVTAITVNVVKELEAPAQRPEPLVTDALTVHVTPAPDSPRALSSHHQNSVSVMSTRPDASHESVTISYSPPRPTASERLYQSHQELLQRNRLGFSQSNQYLLPDNRGTSYPPLSPTRGSLKRGLAFSYSFKNPPLAKMGSVYSQSQLEPSMYSSQPLDRQPSPSPSERSERRHKLLGSRRKAASFTEPEESAASSSGAQTRHASLQENVESGAERYGSDEQVG